MSSSAADPPPQEKIQIRSVYADNLDTEFAMIRDAVESHPFAAMDTEFPGVVFRPAGHPLRLTAAERYSFLRANVNALRLVQVGLTLSDSVGQLPMIDGAAAVWEFNFSDFDPDLHPHAPESIKLLRDHGIDFDENRRRGIDSKRFAELLMSSGLVCSFDSAIKWVAFHGAYDFAYLIKILTRRSLPEKLETFMELVKLFFGDKLFDVKHLTRFCGGRDSLHGGLDRVASLLEVERAAGKCHQAGSDSLLTWHAFVRMRDRYFVDDGADKHAGVLYGLEILCQ